MLKGPVIGLFSIFGETTCRELTALQVIADAITTDALAGTRIIAAVT